MLELQLLLLTFRNTCTKLIQSPEKLNNFNSMELKIIFFNRHVNSPHKEQFLKVMKTIRKNTSTILSQ